MSGTASAQADEDAMVFPPAWKRLFHPRRGGVPVNPPVVAADPAGTVRQLVEPAQQKIGECLDAADTPLAEAGRGYLAAILAGGPPSHATPLAAAVFAAAAGLAMHYPSRLRARTRAITDMWVTGRGPVFAARATAELAGLVTSERERRGWRFRLYQEGADDDLRLASAVSGYHCLPIPQWLRRHLVAVTAEDYRAVCAVLDEYHDPTPRQRAVMGYLIPTETRRFDETMDVIDRALAVHYTGTIHSGNFLLHSAGTVAQIERVQGRWAPWALESTATLVDAVGPAIAALVAAWFDNESAPSRRQRHAAVLALLPGDEAFTLLLERGQHIDAQTALAQARARFPNRARRLATTSC